MDTAEAIPADFVCGSFETIRWIPDDEALSERRTDQSMPPLVSTRRRELNAWRDRGNNGSGDCWDVERSAEAESSADGDARAAP